MHLTPMAFPTALSVPRWLQGVQHRKTEALRRAGVGEDVMRKMEEAGKKRSLFETAKVGAGSNAHFGAAKVGAGSDGQREGAQVGARVEELVSGLGVACSLKAAEGRDRGLVTRTPIPTSLSRGQLSPSAPDLPPPPCPRSWPTSTAAPR